MNILLSKKSLKSEFYLIFLFINNNNIKYIIYLLFYKIIFNYQKIKIIIRTKLRNQ